MEDKNQLTKREYFAIKAMAGLLSNSTEAQASTTFILDFIGEPKDTVYSFEAHYKRYISKLSVMYADALLAELSTKND